MKKWIFFPTNSNGYLSIAGGVNANLWQSLWSPERVHGASPTYTMVKYVLPELSLLTDLQLVLAIVRHRR